MSDTARDWLPPGVVGAHAIGQRLDSLIRGWSRRWFLAEGCAAGTVAQTERGRPRLAQPEVEEVRSEVGAVSALVGARGRQLLLDHALGRASDEIIAEGDRPVLAAFVKELVADLVREIENGLDCKVPVTCSDTAARLAVRDAKAQELLWLHLTAEARRALIRCAFGEPREAVRLDPRVEALAGLSVAVEARAGTVVLGLGQLGHLAPGDVLILDRAIDSGVEIAVKGGSAFALAELSIGKGEAEAKLIRRI